MTDNQNNGKYIMRTEQNRIMVTGGKGYIGRSFINKYGDEYELIPVSLSSKEKLDFGNVSTVVHLSALVHQTKKIPDEQYFSVNTEQTVSLAKEAKKSGVRHFVFYSTVAVYGLHGDLADHKKLINENSFCNPTSAYAKSKYDAEKSLLKLEDEQFVVSIIRPPLVYGKDAPGNMLKLKKLVELFPVLPFSYENNKRSMVYIDNLTYFTKMVIDKRVRGIFIPQDEDKYSIKEIVKTIAECSGNKILLIKFPIGILWILAKIKPQMIASLYGTLLFDSTASNKKTGYYPKITTKDGLNLMSK